MSLLTHTHKVTCSIRGPDSSLIVPYKFNSSYTVVMKRTLVLTLILISSLLMTSCSIASGSKSKVETQIELACDAYDSAARGLVSPSGRKAIVEASKLARLDSGYLAFSAAITWDIAYGGNSKTYTPDEVLEGQKALTIIAGLCGR